MFEIDIKFQAEFNELFDSDIKQFQSELRNMMIKALPEVREDMKEALKRHIETDVYSYSNKAYPRRKDNPQFGPSLIDFDTRGQMTPIGDIDANATWAVVGFNYTPDGSHSGTTADLDPSSKYYDADNPRAIKPNPVHRDALIRRIETGAGYDWKTKVKPRKFWQNFINEMTETDALEDSFVRWLSLQDKEILVEADGGVIREADDGAY